MANITAVTSSVQGESLNVLDPNTWVGGVVPGPADTAIFPHRTFSYYRNTGHSSPTSTNYYHPIQGPWSGSNGMTYNKLTPNGVDRAELHAYFTLNSHTNLGLDEGCHANGPYSSSVFAVMLPSRNISQMINIKYKWKASNYFASCSLNNEFSEWQSSNLYTSSLEDEFTGNKPSGYWQYNSCYFIRNYNQYHLTGSATWSVGHVDMGNFTEFEVRDAKLELASTTPYIDMTYGSYQSIKILGSAHIQASGSATTTRGGIYAYRRNYISILISGSANYSSSYMTQAAEEGDTTINVANSDAFGEGDLISIHEDPNQIVFNNRVRMRDDRYNYTFSQTWDNRNFLTSSVSQSAWGGVTSNQDVPNSSYVRLNYSGSIMNWEWAKVVSSSNNQLTVGKLLSKRGKVEAQLGTYTYQEFVETFGDPISTYEGSKRAILVDLPNVERGFTAGESVTINDKAYDILHETSYLTQSIFIDFTKGDVDPRDVFIWSDNILSGSAYSQTQLQGSYYSWDEYYRKHTLWDSGSHETIYGTVKASGSFFLNPFKQRSWGAYGTPYNNIRYDTYLYAEHKISGSYWDQGEIEISGSVSDDPFHNTYQERRYDESGSRFNPYSYLGIMTHQSAHMRQSSHASHTQAIRAYNNDVQDYGISYGYGSIDYGLFLRPAWNANYGKFFQIGGDKNPHISGSVRSNYASFPGLPWINSSSLMQEQYNNLMPPFNASGSGESFSLKITRRGTENKYFYRDSGGETQIYTDFMTYHPYRSVGMFIGKGARLYTIRIKNRYRLLLLDTEDEFTKDDNVFDGGLVSSKPSGYRVEHIATEIEDPMGYNNLLKEYYEKRGKTSVLPYIQGIMYTNTTYNSGIGYLSTRYNVDAPFDNTQYGWSKYYSYPYNNASNHYTIDFGAPITFDSIGFIFPGAGGNYGEGVRYPSLSQYGGGNYMTNIGIEYSLDNTTDWNASNVATFRATAPDNRQSTGVTGIRFYTGSAVTAQVIRVYNAGGSRGTAYVDFGFMGAYLGQSGSNARKIKLKNTKNFKVGDEVYFYSFHKPGQDSFLGSPSLNYTNYHGAIYPQYTTNYNEIGYDYVSDPEHRTNGGFAFHYIIVAKDDTERTITLDRDPVYCHLYKGTYVFKKNRGNVKFDVKHPGRQRGNCGLYWSNYSQHSRCIVRNANMDFCDMQSTTNYSGFGSFIENVTCVSGVQTRPYINRNYHLSSGIAMNVFSHQWYDISPDTPHNKAGSYVFGQLSINSYLNGSYQNISNGVKNERNFNIRTLGKNAFAILNGYRVNGGYQDGTPAPQILHNSVYEGTYHGNTWMYQNNYDPQTSDKWNERKNLFFASYYGNSHTSTPSSTNIPRDGYKNFFRNTTWLEKSNLYEFPTQPITAFSMQSYGQMPDARSTTQGYVVRNSPEFVIDGEVKDHIISCGHNYVTSDKPFAIIELNKNHYRLTALKLINGEGSTTTGYDMHKQCYFSANKDTQIRFKFSMEFLIDLSYMLGWGEYTYSTSYPVLDRSMGYGFIPGHLDLSFVVTEYDPASAITKTIFHTYIRNNEDREFKSFNVDETLDIRKSCVYNIFIHHKTPYRQTLIQNIMEYKNPRFALFVNNDSDIEVYYNNFDMEKQFSNDDAGYTLVDGNNVARGSVTKLQSNNLTDPIKTIRLNKIKI